MERLATAVISSGACRPRLVPAISVGTEADTLPRRSDPPNAAREFATNTRWQAEARSVSKLRQQNL